ncbi:MAG: c-type cytochrome [Steroidobacterales bacterium]
MTGGPTPRRLRGLALVLITCLCVAQLARAASVGEEIYRHGLLPSGQPLHAEREPGMRIEGATAACVNCHRRSGLGMKEGRRTIPPVAGIYLFRPRATTADSLDLPFVEGMRADRDPYTDSTLARAIRDGIGADGHPLSYLMPHYTLDDSQMTDLIAYLKSLSPGSVPGVTDSVLHFATIITPDADPLKRQGMLEVLQKFFIDKNNFVRAAQPRVQSTRHMMFKVNRHWELHVWQLKGAPSSWEAQLRAMMVKEPVFAVISGLGGKTWAPVHRFCEAQGLPCLFPNLDLPVVAESDFDSLYLSKGVLLEAQLVAHEVESERERRGIRRVVQVYRKDDVGKDAASALAAALGPGAIATVDVDLAPGADKRAVAAATGKAQAGDAIVLWLRANDIAALGAAPAAASRIYMSGRMGGLDDAPLPSDWRGVMRMSYPFDLPAGRRVQMDYPLGWFRIRRIPVVAEQVQADTYLVCGLVSDAINHMVDTFVRDYLVERIEEMLEHRLITGYYPRLALAPDQRFASKGGYIVHFADATGSKVVADGGWIVP